MNSIKNKKTKKFWPRIVLALVILGIGLGVGVLTYQDISEKKELHEITELQLFQKIDDIAHQEIDESIEENPFNEEQKEMFYQIDAEYHNKRDINERYIIMEKIIHLLIETEKNHITRTGDFDAERDEDYKKLLEEYNEINK